jgi:hypothetical protein
VWFGAWVTVNGGVIRGIRSFDLFPFPFLMMTVSRQFSGFIVLASQNRVARQAGSISLIRFLAFPSTRSGPPGGSSTPVVMVTRNSPSNRSQDWPCF